MKKILPFVVLGCLVVSGCDDIPETARPTATQQNQEQPKPKQYMRRQTESHLLSSNQLVCINDVLYFASWGDGGVVIRSPVLAANTSYTTVSCRNGYSLNQFGILK